MPAVRGRGLGSMGQTFAPYMVDGVRTVGQPVMIRMQGIPTMPGYRDRPGKWNVLLPPLFLALGQILKHLFDRLS